MGRAMGRRSPSTQTEKRDALRAMLCEHTTISEVCCATGVSAQTIARWRQLRRPARRSDPQAVGLRAASHEGTTLAPSNP